MEEQAKTEVAQPKEEKKGSDNTKMIIKIVLGALLILLGLWAVIGWWWSLTVVFKGCIGLFLILAGAITLAIAKE